MSNKIYAYENRIEIQATKDDTDIGRLVSSLSPIHVNRSGTKFTLSIRQLPEVLNIMRGVTSSTDLPQHLQMLYDREMQRRVITEDLILNGPTEEDGTLWVWQKLGIELARVNDRWGFFYDTRTGKTPMSLNIIQEDIRQNPNNRWIVVSSSYLIETAWVPDLQKFTSELTYRTFYGSDKDKLLSYVSKSNILFVSTALLSRFVELNTSAPQLFAGCFFDESSAMKSHKTGTSKSAITLSERVRRWYLLSATPAPNTKAEYYTQMLTIDPYIWPQSRTAFVGKYFDNMSRSYKYEKLVIKPEMDMEFNNLLRQYSLYTDQDVMPTAGKEWNTFEFDMPSSVASAYEKMRKDLSVDIGDATDITVETAAIARSKLRQISSGFIMDTEAIKENKASRILYGATAEQQLVTHVIDTYRADELLKLIHKIKDSEPDAKIVIWANFREEFEQIKSVLGTTKARYINGATAQYKTQFILDFKGSKDIKYLVAHPLSVGMGVNLTEAHHCIYYSLNDSWEQFKQSQERIAGHIKVQPNKCAYWVMQATGAIDRIIYDNLLHKRDQSFGVLEHLKAGMYK